MRISDWSSDVCSSDLNTITLTQAPHNQRQRCRACQAGMPAATANSNHDNGDKSHIGDSRPQAGDSCLWRCDPAIARRSEEHTSELQSLMRISYAVFCLKKKKQYEHNPKLYNKKKHCTKNNY